MSTSFPKNTSWENKNTNTEIKFIVEIGNYEMDDVILDLGLDVNILPNNSWEKMGKPKLSWSLI